VHFEALVKSAPSSISTSSLLLQLKGCGPDVLAIILVHLSGGASSTAIGLTAGTLLIPYFESDENYPPT